jgi:hypothetical protein
LSHLYWFAQLRHRPLSNAAKADWEKAFCLSDDPAHDLTSLRDIVDQRAGFAGNHSGYIKITTLACGCIVSLDLFRCYFQSILMPQPSLQVMIPQDAAGVRVGPAVAAGEIENDRADSLPAGRCDDPAFGLRMALGFL